jgi:hypothetical protein
MDLLVKIHEDKSARLGVKYTYEYQALRSYEDILKQEQELLFSLNIEPLRGKLNLELVSDHSGKRVIYKGLAYRTGQLNKLLACFRQEQEWWFVHIFSRANTTLVARPFGRSRFIRLSQIRLVGEHHLL